MYMSHLFCVCCICVSNGNTGRRGRGTSTISKKKQGGQGIKGGPRKGVVTEGQYKKVGEL